MLFPTKWDGYPQPVRPGYIASRRKCTSKDKAANETPCELCLVIRIGSFPESAPPKKENAVQMLFSKTMLSVTKEI
jgi:hypothetical protein